VFFGASNCGQEIFLSKYSRLLNKTTLAAQKGRQGAKDSCDKVRSASADGGADRRERLVGVATEGRDGGDAHHDDEGQHDCVFDRGRAVFSLMKLIAN